MVQTTRVRGEHEVQFLGVQVAVGACVPAQQQPAQLAQRGRQVPPQRDSLPHWHVIQILHQRPHRMHALVAGGAACAPPLVHPQGQLCGVGWGGVVMSRSLRQGGFHFPLPHTPTHPPPVCGKERVRERKGPTTGGKKTETSSTGPALSCCCCCTHRSSHASPATDTIRSPPSPLWPQPRLSLCSSPPATFLFGRIRHKADIQDSRESGHVTWIPDSSSGPLISATA